MLTWMESAHLACRGNGRSTGRKIFLRPAALRQASARCVAIVLALTVFCSGCMSLGQWAHNGFKVGPNYCKPKAPVAMDWIDYQNPQVVSDAGDLSHWWHLFNDQNLDGLIETAYRQNI